MKLADIVIGQQYEERYVDRPVTVLGFERDRNNRRVARVRKSDGGEKLLTTTNIVRLWAEAEAERVLIQRARELATRLNQRWGIRSMAVYGSRYHVAGNIDLGTVTSEQAQALLDRLSAGEDA